MSGSRLIRVGVIGVGAVGEKILHAFLKHSTYQVAAVCDVSKERVMNVAEKHDISWCTDYQTIVNDPTIDLVYVAVPPKYHHAIVMDVLKAGKHILCEKPLANSLAEAKEMFEAARNSQLVHAMNFPTYYRTAFGEISKLLAAGFLGELRKIEVRAHFHKWPREWQQNVWIGGREQGGFIREVFPHYLHLIQELFGPIINVTSFVEYPEDPAACETGITASAQLQNRVPILFEGVSQIALPEKISFTMYGSAGTISLENWSELKAGGYNEPLHTVELPENDRFYELINELAESILARDGKLVDFAAGYEIQKVLEELLNS